MLQYFLAGLAVHGVAMVCSFLRERVQPLKWTWWGLAGGGLWVMTGILAITAVRLAGIGTTQSLWSGLSIFVSYIWGAYFFKEPIKDHILALVALAIMAIGMAGVRSAGSGNNLLSVAPNLWMSALRLPDEEEQQRWESTVEENLSAHLVSGDKEENVESVLSMRDDCGNLKYDKANRFTQGVLCAVLVGLLNGSFMLPLKFANKDVVGVEYLVSFGVGAMVITILVLMVYSTVLVCSGRPCPCFQLRVAAGPALLTGLLWSIGNYCSIYATLYLGMALGWPLVQCQLLVSAFWAVFFYDEVTGHQARSVLLGSSVLVVSGAIMLSQFGTQ
ncbi:hypothetical protein CY35_09G000800 [Sphagnum magellanicum]|nr:hypothetical protein CY35_09G000800 [Sphagnum magellanicum]KAH9551162.1 hypothetical protein CY35_09G000800 [Sphagnum magellanicum]